jgi:RNA polymerase sigma factor (sigma-70 family)
MGATDFETGIENQFDYFCKLVLRNKARDIYDSEKIWNDRFISIDALSDAKLNEILTYDKHDIENIVFDVQEYQIPVEDILLAKAIETLTQRQQEVILLSFFLDMSLVDIGKLLGLKTSTIYQHKESGLKKLKAFMEENSDDG